MKQQSLGTSSVRSVTLTNVPPGCDQAWGGGQQKIQLGRLSHVLCECVDLRQTFPCQLFLQQAQGIWSLSQCTCRYLCDSFCWPCGCRPGYNSLLDPHLAGYFGNRKMRRHLRKQGLVSVLKIILRTFPVVTCCHVHTYTTAHVHTYTTPHVHTYTTHTHTHTHTHTQSPPVADELLSPHTHTRTHIHTHTHRRARGRQMCTRNPDPTSPLTDHPSGGARV